MADLVITAADFIPSANATYTRGVTGATALTVGMPVKRVANLWVPAQADAEETYDAQGMAALASSPGQPCLILKQDSGLQIGATAAEGTLLAVSADAAGGIAPHGDIGVGEWLYIFGIMLEDDVAAVDFERPMTTRSAL